MDYWPRKSGDRPNFCPGGDAGVAICWARLRARADSALKLVSFYVPRGEVRRPFSYFVPSRRVILDNKPFTLNEACVAKQHGATEVEEPLEKRSEALEEENPKVIAEILVKIRHPGAEIYY